MPRTGGRPRCTGVWPLTGEQCRNPAREGVPTCPAHDPDGDLRRPPPRDEHRCTALCKESGARCMQRRMKGQRVCGAHGGAAAQSREAGAQAVAEGRATALMRTYGRRVDTTPVRALLEEVQWTAGHVEWLRERVQDLEERQVALDTAPHGDGDGEAPRPADTHSLVWGVTRVKTGGDDHGVTQEATANIWLKLYQQERTHLVRVCADAIRAGLDERLVRIAESQGNLVAQAIKTILARLNLTPEQLALVPEVVPDVLRGLARAA